MNNISRKLSFSFAGVTLGGILVAYLLRRTQKKSNYKRPSQKEIIVVTNEEEWDSAWEQLSQDLQTFPILGFDCEWITENKMRNPISLVQLTSISGICILVRTNLLLADDKSLPETFRNILSDKRILKMGVAATEDASKLNEDFGLICSGYVDLRNFVLRCSKLRFRPAGLQKMALDILGVEMDKDYKVRCSNWECKELNERQLMYAAMDSHVSLRIFLFLLERNFDINPSVKNGINLKSSVLSTCQGLVDLKFTSIEKRTNVPNVRKQSNSKTSSAKDLKQMKCFEPRKAPFYQNAKIYSKEGQLLRLSGEKNARRYLEQNLAEKVSDDPLSVRLLCEPGSEILSQTDYELQEKENICVVCGDTDSLTSKSIIPREYKRNIPEVYKMKRLLNVLVVCVQCRVLSDRMDRRLMNHLADKYGAKITNVKYLQHSKAKRAARILIKDEKTKNLPEARTDELKNVLKEFFEVEEITEEILRKGAEIANERQENKEYEDHGWKVMQAVLKEGSLMDFEVLWRQHFLDSMQPKFMPLHWSIHHGHDKMKMLNGDVNIDEDQ